MRRIIYRSFVSILLLILISVFLILGASIYRDLKKLKVDKESEIVAEQINNLEELNKKELSMIKDNKASYSNPFGDIHKVDDIDERTLRFYIYYMTNQKVDAPKEEGFYQITNERIKFSLEVLDKKD